jgi:ribosomal protein L12E/L44/L45/RPP1/RPP2
MKSVRRTLKSVFVQSANSNSNFQRGFEMTIEEIEKVLTDITVKINQLAALNLTIAATVDVGLKDLLRNSKILLAATQNQELRIRKLEGRNDLEI